MGLFGNKPIYKYRVLDKYKVDIDKENEELRQANQNERYIYVGETDVYRIYYFRGEIASNTYLLRQEKAQPKKVVYLGEAKDKMCICGNKLYIINRINYTSRTHHPLYCIDIDTGEKTELTVLSDKGCYIALHWHCQDCVEAISTVGNSVVLDVTRYKENSHYEEECKYRISVQYKDGQFTKKII